MADERSQGKSITWYLFLVLGVLILAIAGYTGYVLYPRFQLPAVSGIGLSLLAAMAGIASFFSPCSFPLLLTLLARETGKDNSKDKPVQWKAFRFAIALSLGASLFLIGTGLLIAAGGAVLFSGVTFASPAGRLIRAVVGVFLIGLGLIQLGVFRINFNWVYQIADPILKTQAKIRRERPVFGFAVFGFGYLLAGFGWTGPILAGLAGHAFSIGGAEAALFAFVVAAVVIAGLMIILAALIASAQERVIRTIRARVQQVKQWGGAVLIVVGVWLIVLSVWSDFFATLFPVGG